MPLYEFERIEKENQRDTRYGPFSFFKCLLYSYFGLENPARRKRRQTQRSRRATALPDREPLRTYRTPTGLVQNALNALEKRVVTQGQRIVPLEPAMEQTFQTIIERDARYNRFIMELAQAGKVLPGMLFYSTFFHSLNSVCLVWMCMGCLKTSKDTFVIRRGPDPTQKVSYLTSRL